MHTRVKICGITRIEDALTAAQAGADAIGFVFDPKSLRHVPLDLIQFHGNEKPEQCRRYHRSYIKAIHMKPDVDLREMVRLYNDAAGLLLDTYIADVAGGSGQAFDWNRIPRDLGKPVILAGGLTPENVAEAVRKVRPFAVDVSSGVEVQGDVQGRTNVAGAGRAGATKGIKDAKKISDFIDAVAQTA